MTQAAILSADRGPGEAAQAFLSRRRHRLLIGGEWREAHSGHTFATYDPATGEGLGEIARGESADVKAAVAAARRAFTQGPWPAMTPMGRARLLNAIADTLEAHIDELAELETLDQGKALYVGRWAEIPGAINQFRYFAGMASKVEGARCAIRKGGSRWTRTPRAPGGRASLSPTSTPAAARHAGSRGRGRTAISPATACQPRPRSAG